MVAHCRLRTHECQAYLGVRSSTVDVDENKCLIAIELPSLRILILELMQIVKALD